jgi:PAS domain S-box-containing protein
VPSSVRSRGRWFRPSLRNKFIVASLAVEVAMLTLMIGNNLRQSRHLLEEQTNARGIEIAETFSIALAPSLAARDHASLRSLVGRLVTLPDVTYLVVADTRNTIMASVGAPPAELPLPTLSLGEAEVMHATVDLALFGQSYGTLHYGLSLAALRAAERDLLRQSIAIALAEVLLSGLGLFTISTMLTRRLAALSKASERLSRGDYDTRVEVAGRDEVTHLARGFNAMIDAVQAQFRELDSNAIAMRRSNAELTRLAEVTAHHMQEPLRGVVSFSELLRTRGMEHLTPEEREYLDYIVTNAQRMKRLLGDLQTYVTLEANPRFGGALVDPSALAERARLDLETRIEDAGARVTIGPMPTIQGDPEQITLLFRHLIANAVDHATPGHAPRITIGADAGTDAVTLSVRDDGPGIDPAYRERVLMIFERLTVDGTGTGIGLALARKIVEAHGGAIRIEDNPPRGTAVVMDFPRAHLDTGDSAPAAPPGWRTPGSGAKPTDATATKPLGDTRLHALLSQVARSEQRLHMLLTTASDGIHVLDSHGNLIEASDNFLALIGRDRSEAVGLNVADWHVPDDAAGELFKDLFPRLFSTPTIFEAQHRRPDGTIIHVEVNTRPVVLDGRPYLYASSRDITDRIQAERRLEHTSSRLRLVLETAAEGIVGTDAGGRITFVNGAAARILGWSDPISRLGRDLSAALGHSRKDGTPCDGTQCQIHHTLTDGQTRRVNDEFFAGSGGRRIPVEYVVSPQTVDGRIEGAVLVFRDISDWRALESELRGANARLEQFASVLSHDLRQPLRTVASYLSLLDRRLGDRLGTDGREFLDYARAGALDMDRLITGILEYSRLGLTQDDRPVDLGACLTQARHGLAAEIAATGARVVATAPLPLVHGNANALTRLFQNLLQNAIKYRAPDRPPVITITHDRDGADWVLSISDNGRGIPDADRDRIFELFHRLDPADGVEGSGLGLAICRRVVEAHGGQIAVQDNPDGSGRGVSFRITLPALAAPPCEPEATGTT